MLFRSLLPSLPCAHTTKQWHSFPQIISSYDVLNGGSEICVSVQGLGTYCLNTTSHTWTEVGKWTLPFNGKAEYVPELKLWFGISASDQTLAAADLSAMDSQPQLLGTWKELDLPEEWKWRWRWRCMHRVAMPIRAVEEWNSNLQITNLDVTSLIAALVPSLQCSEQFQGWA